MIHGSSVTFQDGALYSTVNNDGSVGYKGVPSSEWDRSGSPFEYYGAAAIALKGSTIKGHYMTRNRMSYWFTFNSNVKAPTAVKPVGPKAPTEPKALTEPTKPRPNDKPGQPQEFTYHTYEAPAKPTKETLSGSYSSYVLPKIPDKTTDNGSYNEFTPPEAPAKPKYTYHENTLKAIQDGVKAVKDTNGNDINGHNIPKSSQIQFDLNVSQLPANRPETKTFGITDPLSAGAKFNQKQPKL